MKLGIVGLPNVGKSTLFNAITKAGAESANYPFCTIEPNVGMVAVPDDRLDKLAGIYHPKKVTPTVIEFVDIAGLVRGASRGEGLGNKFLAHIREVDAVVHVVRCFEDDKITHVDETVDPIRDIETINLELIFADLESLEKRMERVRKALKGDRKYQAELDLMERVKNNLEKGIPARNLACTDEEAQMLKQMFLLTSKPVIYAANIAEDALLSGSESNSMVQQVMNYAEKEQSEVLIISAKVEAEIAQLDAEEKLLFLRELGIPESGLDRLVRRCYRLLDLISFLTAGPEEVRAWTIKRGTRAPQAAGKIHSDFERGFIRAEVVDYDTLMESGSMAAAREKGLVRSEGREYEVKDGDVILFRFNV
ncbi:MAG TPA: redox-regulated ATPase YchF [Clostridiales bacterium]|jgi:GTP-binding protein YchF|nr:redox-regulated ATPase YchF [Clostridiales bacterium]